MLKIRPISLCLFEKSDHVLAQEFQHPTAGHCYYRLPGGGIEIGERAEQAVKREMMEELKAEIIGLKKLAVLENIFDFKGRPHHEIIFLFRAEFQDRAFYQKSEFIIEELGFDTTRAIWLPRQKIVSNSVKFYPEKMVGMMANGTI